MWRRSEVLSRWTTFHVGGPAAWFAEPETEEECLLVWHQARRLGGPIRVLGGGSNLLVADEGVPGQVLSLRAMAPRRVLRSGRRLFASAGVALAGLVRRAAREGLAGLEHFAGIPGLVGGAVAMNAGGCDGAVGERVAALGCIDPTGRRTARRGREVRWQYRSAGLEGDVVLNAEFALRTDRPEAVWRRTQDALARKRATQPLGAWSAGCVFRNPAGDTAGRLIDRAGLKGARCHEALVSPQHANFIINRGHAAARDVRRLIERIRRVVRARFHRELQLEIHGWP